MYKRLVYFLATIVVLTLFLPSSYSRLIRDKAAITVKPAGHWLVEKNATINRWFRSLNQLGSLRRDKENLQKQIITLQKQLSDQEQIRKENATLHQELNIPATKRNLPLLMGNIILHGNNPLDQTFVIDIGTKQGLRNGQAVESQGYLIGTVIEARENTSLVRTIVSKKSIVQVWLSQSSQKGLLVGDGNASYLSNIDQGVEVAEHSLIETNGLGNSLPQGILIGTTGATQSKPSDLSQKFLVDQPVDLSSLSTVFVVNTPES